MVSVDIWPTVAPRARVIGDVGSPGSTGAVAQCAGPSARGLRCLAQTGHVSGTASAGKCPTQRFQGGGHQSVVGPFAALGSFKQAGVDQGLEVV